MLGDPAPPKSGEIDPTRVATADDITQVVPFWSQSPWLRSEDRTVGLRVPVYFVSGRSEKGVFVSGRISIKLYRLLRDESDQLVRELVYTWEFDAAQAMNFRVRKASIMGLYYGFVLGWPPDLALDGSLIDVVISYERGDGAVVQATKRWQVPVPSSLPFTSVPRRQAGSNLSTRGLGGSGEVEPGPAGGSTDTTVQQVSPTTVRINLGGARRGAGEAATAGSRPASEPDESAPNQAPE